VSGRKRHLLVDTGGLVLKALVHAANITDRQGGQQLLETLGDLATTFPRLHHLWVDSAYQGSFKDWVEQTLRWTVDVVKRPSRWAWVPADQEPPETPGGFQVLPRRWVVERTLGWLGRWRRTSKDYEYLPATSECVIYLAMIHIMLRRLAET
jgi:putative transposase